MAVNVLRRRFVLLIYSSLLQRYDSLSYESAPKKQRALLRNHDTV